MDADQLTAGLAEQSDVERHTAGSTPPLLNKDSKRVPGRPNNIRHHAAEWWNQWMLEVLSGVLSIVALVATVITLEPNQGKPLPDWPFDISINALLSIYSVVFKTCMIFVIQSCIGQQQWVWFASERRLYDVALFDSARQGPYGSAVWIWVHRLRQPLTTLGAVILILSVAVDPFYQQLLDYVDCDTTLQDTAWAARSNYFDAGAHLFVEAGSPERMLPDAQSALRSGVFSRPDAMQPHCSSGNCTFETYSTVGYCNECQDVSEDLKFTAVPVEDQEYYGCGAPPGFQNYIFTSYLPSNFSMIWNTSDFDGTQVLSSTAGLEDPVVFEIIAGKTTLSDLTLDPTTGENLTWCDDPIGSDDDWRCRGYGAARCSLFPCVRTYNTTVDAGSVTEDLIEHTTLETLRDQPFWDLASGEYMEYPGDALVLVNTSCISSEDEQQLLKTGHRIDSKWLVYTAPDDFDLDILYPPDAGFPGSMVSRGCTYAFDDFMLDYGLWNFFSTSGFLTGNTTGSLSCPDAHLLSFSGPSELQVLYNSSNVSFRGLQDTFDNMATSFTNYMRANGHENYSAPAHGTVSHYATCLEVRWAWIAFPAVLVAMTVFVLLPLTVHVTLRADVPTWKDGLLPLVFRGPLVYRDREETRQSDDEDEELSKKWKRDQNS
ncbi:hypothetical protein KVR01_013228 [Diaporthe batatas]|uniref:uncharacterized protein n=1 Tax=Diaporthe batatas TaxID=748121 RepID=UPI001D05208D|nr:uncharacterized protein KVR01_013228 [Diaporthe batatas]KAG8157006.1 hypothetical protein KVR01_013228 [Diaporthe batatas]